MATVSERLYEEFLDNYQLNRGFFMHSLEMAERKLEKIDTLKVITFKKVRVPVSPAVKNSVTFRNQLHMAEIMARREVEKIIRDFRSFRMDEEDMNRMCDQLAIDGLGKLLLPFHVLTVEAELEEKDFYPIAHEMEIIVCDFLDLLDDFCEAFMAGETRIQRQADAEVAEKNRQTRAWAANAPVEVRGTARVLDGRIHVDATVRSTVTQGQIAADYQVHQLMANQSANRRRDEQQRYLLKDLEEGLVDVIRRYIPAWIDCLKTKMGYLVGKNVISSAVCGSTVSSRPQEKENARKLLCSMTDEDDFARIEYFLNYYEHDYDDLLGDKVAAHMINDYAKYGKVDENYLHYRLFCYLYGKESPVEHKLLFKRLKGMILKQIREKCEEHYQRDKESYMASICDKKLGAYYRLFDAIPGLSEQQHRELVNGGRYIFYDVMGDVSRRDIYDEKNGIPVFDWSPDEN